MNFPAKLACMLILAGMICLSTFSVAAQKTLSKDYPIQPVSFTRVKVTDQFWAPRMEQNQRVTIPIAIDQCYKTGPGRKF